MSENVTPKVTSEELETSDASNEADVFVDMGLELCIADECQFEGKSIDAAVSVVTTTVSEADERIRTDYAQHMHCSV